MFQIAFLVSWESSQEGGRGASAWFHGIWTCGVEVLEYLNDSFTENEMKLN